VRSKVRSQAREKPRYRGVLRQRDSPLGLALLPSILLHLLLGLGLMGWSNPERRPMIEREVYMVSAVVLPRAERLPDKAAAPVPRRRGEAGKKPEPPPIPDEMVLKKPDKEKSEGKPEKPVKKPPKKKPKKKPKTLSREELLAQLDESSDEFRFASSPEGDPDKPPDRNLKEQYGRQLTAYERMVRDQIQFNWFPKYSSTKRTGLWAAVGFTIDDAGNIRTPQIDHSSNDFVYDQSCLRAVTRTRRVKPPPEGANRTISVGFSPEDKK